MGKSSFDTKTAQKTKNVFRMTFLNEENQIGPDPWWNGHGNKTCKWMSFLVQFNLVNQTINRKTKCQEYVPQTCPEFAP